MGDRHAPPDRQNHVRQFDAQCHGLWPWGASENQLLLCQRDTAS
jgi:hypothetical protein